MNKLDKDLETIRNALMSYCEDCVSSDQKEQKKVQKAWDNIVRKVTKK